MTTIETQIEEKNKILKGLEKVALEFGLMALAHNLRKKIAA